MVNISHDDYFSSSTVKGKELSPEDIEERTKTYNSYTAYNLKPYKIYQNDPAQHLHKTSPNLKTAVMLDRGALS